VTELFLLVIVACAAATQRITGVGVGLICTPFLVLGNGPLLGVLMANTLCILLNIMVLAQTWRRIEGRRIFLLAIGALAAIPLGYYVLRHISAPALMIAVGLMALIGLGSLQTRLKLPKAHDSLSALAAGWLGGFMNVTAGIGGPPIVMYASTQQWEQKSFVASIQLYFLIVNVASVMAENPANINLLQLLKYAVCLLVGSVAGHYLAKGINPDHARTGAVLIAGAGATAVVVKGLLAVL